jgi:hypothetical protein
VNPGPTAPPDELFGVNIAFISILGPPMDNWNLLSALDKQHKQFSSARHGHANNFSKGHHHHLPAHVDDAVAEAAEAFVKHPQLPHHIHHKLVHPSGTHLSDADLLHVLRLLAHEHHLHSKSEAMHLLSHIRHHLDHAKPNLPAHRRKQGHAGAAGGGKAGSPGTGTSLHRRHRHRLIGIKHHLRGH